MGSMVPIPFLRGRYFFLSIILLLSIPKALLHPNDSKDTRLISKVTCVPQRLITKSKNYSIDGTYIVQVYQKLDKNGANYCG